MRLLKYAIGDRVGRLTITEHLGKNDKKKRNSHYWRCACDCGGEVICETSQIGVTTNSCGCIRKETTRERTWKGVGEIPGSYWCSLRNGAKSRSYEFSITLDDAWNLFLKQNRKCALTNQLILFPMNSKERGTASLDRVDSSRGYVLGNVQWVHRDVNKMKMEFSSAYFIQLCQLVAENN